MGASERSAIQLVQARYSPCCVPGNIRNTAYEMDNRISKEVQALKTFDAVWKSLATYPGYSRQTKSTVGSLSGLEKR